MAQDMLLTEEKLQRRLWELSPYRYRNKIEIKDFYSKEDTAGVVNPTVPTDLTKEGNVISLGEKWKGRDRYLWLQKKIVIPVEWDADDKGEPVGVFDFGVTGSGYNFGFESMLYIDGEPYQSVDTNHQETFFRKEHIGKEITLTFRLWSGLEGGGEPRELEHCLNSAFIALLDKDTDDYYYTADTVRQTVAVLKDEQMERHELLHVLNKSMLLVDWNEKGSVEFYESVRSANDMLQNAIDNMDKHTKATVSCVGHTHIDTAWRWRLKHTAEKASRSFSTVLRYMEKYPEYLFLHTQPQQYAYIKEYFPEIYEQIQKRAKEGKWEIDGAMWVEPDCNLPSGESLTRQILMGRKFMKEEFDHEPEYLWLPDVFGYSYALPQILKKSGINMFMTTKIAWNQYNRMPNDTFWWKGLDGSQVLAHFITNAEPGQNVETNFYSNYNGLLYPDTITGSWKLYREKRVNPEILMSYGYGDGGGGVTRDMLERRRRIDRMPGLPNVKTSRAGDFFRRLQDSVEKTEEKMAIWDGEMYLEYHRGTYTTQAYVKKMNRRMEELYRKAEWITALGAVNKGDLTVANQEELNEGWKMILTHQFHDIIPGSSISEVYEDAKENYTKMKKIATDIINEGFCNLGMTESKYAYTVINALSDDRSSVVKLDIDSTQLENKKCVTEDGQEVLTQVSDEGVWAYVENVPAMGVKHLYIKEFDSTEYVNKDEKIENSHFITKNINDNFAIVVEKDNNLEIATPYYDITLNEMGQISAMYDKKQECNVLAEGECANVLQLFEDKPLDYDAWDIDMFYIEKIQIVSNLVSRKIVENGAVRLVIRQEWLINKSVISQDMILYKHTGRIDFKTHVDWQERQKLLKTSFPVDIRSTYATYDIQYGNIRRANNSNSSWERAKFEVVGHRFADLSEYGYGVSLLNNCKYGYDIHQNVMRLTLLKAAIWPDVNADKGEHDFTYAIYPHKADFVKGNTIKEAADLNQPLEAIKGVLELPSINGSTIKLTGANVELDAFKKSEDGKYLVLRFHEYAGAKGKMKVDLGFDVSCACESDLMERPIEEMKEVKNNQIEVEIRPYEIKTYLIQL